MGFKNENEPFTKKLELDIYYKESIEKIIEYSKYLNSIDLASSVKFFESVLLTVKSRSLLDEFVSDYTYIFELPESTINNKNIFLKDSLSNVGELVYEMLLIFNIRLFKKQGKIYCEVDTFSFKDYEINVNEYVDFIKEIFK